MLRVRSKSIAALLMAMSAAPLWAQIVTPESEFDKRVRSSQAIQPLGDKPFGENVDLYTGSLSFSQTDIVQEGQGLPIELTRTLEINDRSYVTTALRALVDWRLAVPHIETLTSPDARGFFWGNTTRCSSIQSAPTIVLNSGSSSQPIFYPAEQWWGGYQLDIPGSGKQDLLKRDSSNGQSPQGMIVDGAQISFPIVTKNSWMIGCLPKTANGVAGEGVFVVSPEGTKYWMDWLVSKPYEKVGFGSPNFGSATRVIAMILVSRAEDKLGNTLSYSYDGGGNLTKIAASDGRSLTLNYESWSQQIGSGITESGVRIASAVLQAADTQSRSWAYRYSVLADGRTHLISVIQPDGASWGFDLAGFNTASAYSQVIYPTDNGCNFETRPSSTTATGTMSHPSGLTGKFTIGSTIRGRSYVPYVCDNSFNRRTLVYPSIYVSRTIAKKEFYGPGISPRVWNYAYSPANNSWSKDCGSSCASTVWTDVVDPTGSVIRHTHSNRFDAGESQLLTSEQYSAGIGSSLLKRVQNYYASSTGGPWPSRYGSTFSGNLNADQLTRLSPLSSKATGQDSTTYTYAVNSYDVFARPVNVTRYSPWHRRTDITAYYDSFSKWAIGQEANSTNADSGLVERQITYNSNAQPTAISAFGKLKQTISYNGDGTIAAVTDGNNNTATLSTWKRGIPQSIRFSDGTGVSAVVNDNGWITSVSDQGGYVTGYSYDAMGRLSSINYPVNDSSAWNATLQSFEQVGTSEYDIAAGHWRQTVSTGNARKITYFDAMLQPLLTREYDAANESGTQRFQRFSYDNRGQLTFSSYPGSGSALNTGTWAVYDVLGRLTSSSQDSELGRLTTATSYLSGNQTSVTNPRGQVAVTGYQVFDQPAYDKPVWIQQPEGTYTDIARDLFGKPTSIARRNANGSQALTRTYAYNGNQELCRSVEPETGATLMGYDSAGNMKWSAAGLPSDIGCDQNGTSATIATRRVDRSYDSRNRLSALFFPDGNGNQRWTYWPDGLVKQITTINGGVASYNSYTYNRRRLLVGESQGQADGETWAISSIYNANGHLAMQRYPTGMTVDYAPNALGQATQAGSYATGVSYYPNGALRQFTYGNGIVHSMVQNARQLPDTSEDAFGGTVVLSDGYDYDANGNVAAITDGATGRNQRGNRTMTYDGLDRLRSTVSPMFGTAEYRYDALDNLTYVKAPGRENYYCYDPYWHLTNIKINECSGSTVVGLAYDLQGNLTNKNGQAYVFDFGNRLRAATTKESYRYDGNGRRTQAIQSAGSVGWMYDQAGVLRFQKNQRLSKTTEYILLSGSNVAEVEWTFGQVPAMKDALTWPATPGSVRYVVEESVDGLTWTSVYEGDQINWTSLSRPSGTYSYRVLACTQDGACNALAGLTHIKRSAVDIVPLLYQILLN
ncbi:RHS repeat domain-containing protein [Xanthomonas arboricola]|uniref:RHS repeat domain-containing protein n=1 Tax=Xanthomonas arboricola TaxID=56448 RepID=UPI001EE98709|nr:RHS repeat domain-containing protein [Xanthomonas arboricola]